MALTISQATQVNLLLGWLLKIETEGHSPTFDEAREAAAALADAAHHSLLCGLSGERVIREWDARNRTGQLRRRRAQAGNRKSAIGNRK